MERGWIYVLVNSAMPGLVKVGRTTRPPAERVAELSGATGVALPFVLAFEHEFADCTAAERLIHAELDRRGRRVAANREFFSSPASEVVRLILQLAARLPGAAEDAPPPPPLIAASVLLAEGDRARNGLGATLEDRSEAARLYNLAALRGSLVAVERLGAVCLQSHLLQPSRAARRRALRYLKDGLRRGNYYCAAQLARLYAAEGHVANFGKCWDKFFADRAAAPLPEAEADTAAYPAALILYVDGCLRLGLEPGYRAALAESAEAMVHALADALDRVRDDPDRRARLAWLLRWVRETLFPAIDPAPAAPFPPLVRLLLGFGRRAPA